MILRKRSKTSSRVSVGRRRRVELRLRGVGDHVDFRAGAQHGGRDRGAQHGVDLGIALADLVGGARGGRRIFQLRDQRRQPGVVRQFADGVQVGAGGGVQLHGLIGLAEAVDGARQVLHGVIVARQRAVPGGAARRHLEARRDLLRRLDLEDGHARRRSAECTSTR